MMHIELVKSLKETFNFFFPSSTREFKVPLLFSQKHLKQMDNNCGINCYRSDHDSKVFVYFTYYEHKMDINNNQFNMEEVN